MPDDKHDAYCAKSLWKYEPLSTRVQAIQQRNRECVVRVSVFAARCEEDPVAYRHYAGEPEFY